MSHYDHRHFDGALERIEQAILPNLSRLLDQVLESAALARPGVDAEAYAAALRKTACEVGQLTDLVAMVSQPANISA
jgi:hypothetical protein